MRLLDVGYLFGGACRDYLAAGVTAFGSEIDDVVCGPDHIQVVLDDDDGVPRVHEPVQDGEQLLDVREVKPRRRLVQDVDGLARRPLAQLARQLDSLGFATGERGGAQGLVVVAASFADLARDVDVREEVHLYPDLAVPPARLAPASLYVEREPSRLVAPDLGLRRRGEELPYVVEDLGVGRRVGTGRPPDRALVYFYDLVDVLDAPESRVPAGTVLSAADGVGQGLVEDLVDQRALPRPQDARDTGEDPERKPHVHAFQVVLHRPE